MFQPSSASSTSCSNSHKKKTYLIDIICYELVSTVELLNLPNSLVVTGKTPIPTEICNGLQILRPDLKTMHEEADGIIPHQVVYLASLGCCSIKVISDDTDSFVPVSPLLCREKVDQYFSRNPQVKDVNQLTGCTVSKQRSIAPQPLSVHVLSGSDCVASYFGIGKTKVVQVLEAGNRLNH